MLVLSVNKLKKLKPGSSSRKNLLFVGSSLPLYQARGSIGRRKRITGHSIYKKA